MLKLIGGNRVAGEFRKMLKSGAEPPVVAVAFWGTGAVKSLDLGEVAGARVICNLESGATNPDEIELLLNSAKVRSHPRLHAKLYVAGTRVIVGSSNASANGLSLEGSELSGWVEANVLSDEPQIVDGARTWFEQLWSSSEAWPVTTKMLADVKAIWQKRRAIEPLQRLPKGTGRMSLLRAFRSRPRAFDAIHVAAYDEDLGPGAAALLERLREGKTESAPEEVSVADFANAHAFQGDWGIRPGYWIIEVNLMGKAPRFYGYSKAQDPLTILNVGNGDEEPLTITIHQQAIRIPAYPHGLNLSKDEKKSILDATYKVFQRAKKRGLWLYPLRKVVAEIDRARPRDKSKALPDA